MVKVLEPLSERLKAPDPSMFWVNGNEPATPSGSVSFLMMIVPRFVFVYVQETLPPAGTVIFAVALLGVPPVLHVRLVRSQPVVALSVTE